VARIQAPGLFARPILAVAALELGCDSGSAALIMGTCLTRGTGNARIGRSARRGSIARMGQDLHRGQVRRRRGSVAKGPASLRSMTGGRFGFRRARKTPARGAWSACRGRVPDLRLAFAGLRPSGLVVSAGERRSQSFISRKNAAQST